MPVISHNAASDSHETEPNLIIEIRGAPGADPSMFSDILRRCTRYHDSSTRITIACNAPERNGALQYMLLVEYRGGGQITIGALRRPGREDVEYHS